MAFPFMLSPVLSGAEVLSKHENDLGNRLSMIEIMTALKPLLLTLEVASLATLFPFLTGVALARLMSHFRFPGKEWLDAILTLEALWTLFPGYERTSST